PLVRKFGKLGLTWTLDVLGPFRFGEEGDPDIDKGAEGVAAGAGFRESGADLLVQLQLVKAGDADPDPAAIVRNDSNFKKAEEKFDGIPVPEIVPEKKVGNAYGAMRGMSGKSKEDGKLLAFRWYVLNVRSQIFEVFVEGHSGLE